MTKYSRKFKIELVHEHQLGFSSYEIIGLKYRFSLSMVIKWVSWFRHVSLVNEVRLARHKFKDRRSFWMPKESTYEVSDKLISIERETLVQENMKLRAELHQALMERDSSKV
ncbi:hypothetical protein [Furfurilactobacillus entadae]|uniref:hypothetical protein n=1 Tax=Furfurilactobacillus entadae TaxID=2922307 RepID=UPI0035E6C210